MIFNITDSTGAISGMPTVRVYTANGRLKAMGTPVGTVAWGDITGTVTDQTDLITYLGLNFYPLSSNPAGYLTSAAADLLYYPLSSNPANYITLTSLSAGTGISYDNTTGVITNDAPDQVVSLSDGTGISVTGTYPSFTITNTEPDQVVSLTAGTGIDITGTYPSFTITNTEPAITYTADSGLTPNPTSTNFQLGGTLLLDTTISGDNGTYSFNLAELYKLTAVAYDYIQIKSDDAGATNNYSAELTLDHQGSLYRPSASLYLTNVVTGDTGGIEITDNGSVSVPQMWIKPKGYSGATTGDVLTLQADGTVEYQTISGLNPGFQDVLITDSVLTQNNTVNGGNFNFTFSNTNRFSVASDQYISLNSTAGSNIASATVNSLGVASYIDLNVKDGVHIAGIYLEPTKILVVTPAVNAGTATVGQVLTLTNAASGQVEFQDAPSSTGNVLSPFLLMGG